MVVFTASDGTTFEDRNAWRKYEFETNYTFRNQKQQTLVKAPGKIGGQPFDISDLDECEVLLLDQCDQVQVDNLTNCRVFIGPCSESVFVRNCTNCVFTVACKQLRTRDSSQCSFYLYSLTDPIIETSQEMHFAPFNGAYNGIERHFGDARLEPTNNHWSQVYDFNDPDKSGHNWKLLTPQEEVAPWTVDLSGHVPDPAAFGPCVNPVARDSGFIKYTESNSSTIASFTFKTSQRNAEKAMETQAPAKDGAAVAVATAVTSAPPAATPAPPMSTILVAAPPLPPAVATFAGTATVVHFPPPTPLAPIAAQAEAPGGLGAAVASENHKVAAIKPAEPLAPPLAQEVVPEVVSKAALPPLEHIARSSTAQDGDAEPASDAADILEQLLSLGPSSATPAM